MSEQLPSTLGFFLYTATYPDRLTGAKAPPTKRELFATLAEAERARERFRYQHVGARNLNLVATIVPTEQAKSPKKARR